MTQKFLSFWVLPLVLLLLPVGLAGQAPESQGEGPTLQPGDRVRIVVWRQPELSGEFDVAPDGSITHPLFRQVRVADLPISAVEQRLRDFLERFEANPQFVVEPLLRIATAGEVRLPSLYSLPAGTTVAQAIITAGGPTEFGRLDRVRVVRGGEEIRGDLTDPADPLLEMPVHSGDQIVVGRRRAFFRDVIWPAATISGSLATFALLIERLF